MRSPAARRPRTSTATTLVSPKGTYPAELRRHDLEVRLALLDRFGIDVAVVSLQPTLGLQLLGASPSATSSSRRGRRAIARGRGRRRREDPPALAAPAAPGLRRRLGGCRRARRPRRCWPRSSTRCTRPAASSSSIRSQARRPPRCRRWWAAVVDYTGQMQRAYFAWLAGWPGAVARPSRWSSRSSPAAARSSSSASAAAAAIRPR